jgi:hypothetical protein
MIDIYMVFRQTRATHGAASSCFFHNGSACVNLKDQPIFFMEFIIGSKLKNKIKGDENRSTMLSLCVVKLLKNVATF